MKRLLFGLICSLALMSCGSGDANVSEDVPVKRIALTFDDAPTGDTVLLTGEDRTQRLMMSLQAVEVDQVAFFVTTRGLEADGGVARIEAYADAGHIIANHSHAHLWAIRTSVEDYLADVDLAQQWLDKIDIPAASRRAWFRFPFLDEGTPLDKRDALRAGLAERNLKNGYVTVDNYDWHINNLWRRAVRDGRSVDLDILQTAYIDILMSAIEFYDAAAVKHLGISPPHVLLLHENDTSAMFIDDLVSALRTEGWEIISPDEAYKGAFAQTVPQTVRTRQGHLAALAIEAGADLRSFDHLAINEDQIEAFLEERGAFGAAAK